MTEQRRHTPYSLALAAVLAGLAAGGVRADPPQVRELRVQRAGDTTYFQVRFQPPADLESVPVGSDTRSLTRQPRLVPQDGKTQAVYHRFNLPNNPQGPAAGRNNPPPPSAPPVPF